ncbi:MAG: DMT family transporter [Thermoguttaceae bacterium]|jgi:drug/metabolite transporter (DMT)-like permease
MAAVCYTVGSICMRQVSALGCDPSWAVCVKESITVLVIGPCLIYRAVRGLRVFPPVKILFILILAGLVDQLLGNLAWQCAVGIVGLAVTVPAAFGVMITGSAIFGRFMLGERVTPRSMLAIGLLLVSLILLSLGAESAGEIMAKSSHASVANPGPASATLLVAEAVVVAGVAGAAFALLSIAIRHTMNADTQQSTLMFIITGIGVITLGPISIHRQGLDGLLSTTGEQLAWMVAAGFFNLLGFIGFTKGLHLTTVVRANVLSASQVAMAAVAGILVFQESPNLWLLLGVALTLSGIFLIDRPVAEQSVDRAI